MESAGAAPQGAVGRKRVPNRERPSAEDDALNQIAREGEARLAAKRAARAEAREIRMKELEKQQKEIYQVQKKYYGLGTKFGDIEQWMEDNERYSHKSRRNASASDEDEHISGYSRGSFRPSEYSCYLGSESRASSRTSSARASPVVEERSEKDFEKGIRTASSLSAATLASLGGTFSRRGSGDTSVSIDTEASIREIKDSLAEVEEKYKKAMVSNAQLDNEKTNFMYQVDTLQDALLELEEQLAESKRQFEEKSKDFEREKHAHAILQFQFMEVKEALKQREELLAQYGIIPNLGVATNGEISDCLANDGLSNSSKIVSETSHASKVSEDCTVDIRLKRLLDEREFLLEQIKKLKAQLEEKQNSNIEKLHLEDGVLENGTDMHVIDLQRDANRQISDLKFKLAKSEQEITALEQNPLQNGLKSLDEEDGGILMKLRKRGSRNVAGEFTGKWICNCLKRRSPTTLRRFSPQPFICMLLCPSCCFPHRSYDLAFL
ncbi:leucine-rich repeat flightless-interacting protein 1 isoform 22-T22 [Liasis olivaceus]